MLSELFGIFDKTARCLRCSRVLRFLSLRRPVAPEVFVRLHPVSECPTTLANYRQRKDVPLMLYFRPLDEFDGSLCPIVLKRFVVGLLHELINMDEIQVAIGAIREVFVGGYKCIINCCEPLLTVQDDMLRLAVSVVSV